MCVYAAPDFADFGERGCDSAGRRGRLGRYRERIRKRISDLSFCATEVFCTAVDVVEHACRFWQVSVECIQLR